MSTFVLVHGAWHGGWCWDRVIPVLRAAGHVVHTPTLTGLSERAHLLSPQVGLDTHVEDVVRLLDVLDLCEVVLVGHSYAGQVITAVADRRPARIARLVHLDAFLGTNGEAARDLLPEAVARHWAEAAAGPGLGWLVPVRSLSVLGVTEQTDIDWLTPGLTPHPWKTYTDPLRLTGAAEDIPGVFVECVNWMRVFSTQADRARQRGWPVYELDTGHEAMVTAPKALADVLLDLTAR
ncbi:alpha/beta fold hydrolase [Streptomyces sp. NPDC002588]|uniref:alpha/beta fold hydrolase n=1 Tax=Streptomyces sp. NPDC002588 TaxID=3154419 RepID=UPI0033215A95